MFKSKAGSRPSTPYMECVELPGLETPKVESTCVRTLSVTPVKVTLAPLKSPQVDLHRSIVLPDSVNRLSRPHAYFDVARPTSHIRLRYSYLEPKELTPFHRDKLATKLPTSYLTIHCDEFYPKWKIIVKRANGVTCGDVFDAIYNYLRVSMDEEELDAVSENQRTACQEAFKRRCHEKPVGLSEVEQKDGMRRVDYLAGKTMFGGLYMAPQSPGQHSESSECCLKMKLSHAH